LAATPFTLAIAKKNDAERKQDFAEAIASYDLAVSTTYREFGYDPMDVPKAAVTERVRFILERVEADAG